MTFFSYLDAHPALSFAWFALLVFAAYFVPVMAAHAITNIIRGTGGSRRAVVTQANYRGF